MKTYKNIMYVLNMDNAAFNPFLISKMSSSASGAQDGFRNALLIRDVIRTYYLNLKYEENINLDIIL